MKKLNLLVLVFLLFFTVAVFAQNNLVIPKGMEAIQVGGSAKVIVPKGALTRYVGSQLIVEGTKEYVARKVEEVEERLTKLEANQELLLKEVQSLKVALNATQKTNP
jgi:hypothetical protein